jgi:hypothetical protein
MPAWPRPLDAPSPYPAHFRGDVAARDVDVDVDALIVPRWTRCRRWPKRSARAARSSEERMPTAIIGGIATHHEVAGDGPPLLMSRRAGSALRRPTGRRCAATRGCGWSPDCTSGAGVTPVLPGIDALKRREGTLLIQGELASFPDFPDFPVKKLTEKAITIKSARGHSFRACELALRQLASARSPSRNWPPPPAPSRSRPRHPRGSRRARKDVVRDSHHPWQTRSPKHRAQPDHPHRCPAPTHPRPRPAPAHATGPATAFQAPPPTRHSTP